MIIAAGLTPAWQQIMRFERLATGQVNRAVEVAWCASGKVLNVGLALARLETPSETIALVGGSTGQAIARQFAAAGMTAHWVQSAQPTRVCTTLLDAHGGETTELVQNAAVATSAELEAFAALYAERAAQASMVVLAGSLPAGAPASYYRELLAETPCPAVLDVRGPELWAALEQGAWLVKPNREELARTVGGSLASDDQLLDAMAEVNRRGAQWVLISQGAGAVWLSGENRVYRLTPPRVAAVNPIGSGDCLAAGIALARTQGASPVQAVRFGMAAAVENVLTLLPAELRLPAVRARVAQVAVDQVA